MFRLPLETDPRWVNIAEKNIEEILSDHAYCEQKAASSAISFIVQYPEYPELVTKMAELAREEMEHFQRVHQFIVQRGYRLGKERSDPYVNDLLKFVQKGGSRIGRLVDLLLMAALIEARSCERFRLLSENVSDIELSGFYRELMESEARHYTLFITLARSIADRKQVDARWVEFLDYEGTIVRSYGTGESIHG